MNLLEYLAALHSKTKEKNIFYSVAVQRVTYTYHKVKYIQISQERHGKELWKFWERENLHLVVLENIAALHWKTKQRKKIFFTGDWTAVILQLQSQSEIFLNCSCPTGGHHRYWRPKIKYFQIELECHCKELWKFCIREFTFSSTWKYDRITLKN